ncbi:MAG: acyl-CoA synthetase FdrA, partial [Burkholderiales bacterium]
MTVVNKVRKGFYADSVALMRIARELGKHGVEASLMIGTPSNKALLKESGLLTKEGEGARPDDLIIAVKGKNAQAALALAEKLLNSGTDKSVLNESIANANLVLISVPGEFAAAEARKALEAGMHAMVFSDNVPLKEEVALKELAAKKGLLLMGPDCGTALIAGTPLAFANKVPRGDIGIVSASGTGLQEVSSLLARMGKGVSHGIGVGGRDLSEAVGGRMTLAALDALEADAATKRIIVISKPPAPAVAKRIVRKAESLKKPVTLCLLGAKGAAVRTLEAAAGFRSTKQVKVTAKGSIRGLFCGGTLCAEAAIVLADQGLKAGAYKLTDLGDDEFTRGRPHPMIEPELRNEHIAKALRDAKVGVILLDVVIGYGAHADPAKLISRVLKAFKGKKPLIVGSVTGTEADPQVYSKQVKTLKDAGVVIAESNAQAARIAATAVLPSMLLGTPSPARRPRRSA